MLGGCGVAPRAHISGMSGQQGPLTGNTNQRARIDDLYGFANVPVGNTVIMLVGSQIDVVILSDLIVAVIFEFKPGGGQWEQQRFFLGQKPFASAPWFLVHPGLIVLMYFLGDGTVERVYVKKHLITQFGIDPVVDQLYLIFHKSLVFGTAGTSRYNGGV